MQISKLLSSNLAPKINDLHEHQSSFISCLKDPRVSSYGDDKYLTRPMVSRNPKLELPEEETHHQFYTTIDGLKNRAENISANHEEMYDKLCKILKLLNLRDDSILIQFWSPYTYGKQKFLKAADQPFCLGKDDEGLCNYRRESEGTWFSVDEECEEVLTSVVRVYRQQLPEWTSDVTNNSSKIHPRQDCAIRRNLHGYLVLPVFDSFTNLCVGVLESITSYKYLDYAYEVQEVHRTLKAANLTTPQAFDYPISHDDYKRQHELDEIFKILKDLCVTYKLPLAQTWTVSSRSSFVTTGRNIQMTCSSFNCRCVGKVCMSTTALPFYVHDLRFWSFREVCREHHLLKSEGVVGRALSSHDSCFCANVTKLEEDEYSLVHNTRISGLTSCFAIYMDSREHDDGYVLEFFLPVDMEEGADLQNLVQMLKMHLKLSSFEFGGLITTEVIEMPMEASQLSLPMQLRTVQTSLPQEIMYQLYSKDSHTIGYTDAQIEYINAEEQHAFSKGYPKNMSNAITNIEELSVDDATSRKLDVLSGEKGVSTEQKKLKINSLIFGNSTGEVSTSHDSLSREIVQIDLKDPETFGETNAESDCTNAHDQRDFDNTYLKNGNSAITNTEELAVDNIVTKKIDLVTVEKECNSGDKRVSSKQRRKRKRDSFTRETIHQYFGMPIGKASKCLGVSRSTLKRVCRELEIPSWPLPVRNKKYAHFGISVIVLLLVRVKRWNCSSNRHGFSARWWVCGRHNSFVSKSNPSAIKGEAIGGPLYAAQPLKESDDSIRTLSLRSKSPQARFGIYEAACLLLALKRWRKNTVRTHRMSCNDFLVDGHLSYTFDTFYTCPKKNVVNVPDTLVTVKATYKADMIKFLFPLSSGLLELKNQVAQRFKLKNTKLHLKYRDEDGDLILVACDSDFRDVMPFSTTSVSKNTVKLIVQTAVD